MSLNDGITQKQRGRAELEALVAAFQQSGGTVTRSREHRATAECRICGARHLVLGQRALSSSQLHYRRCGSDQIKIEW